MLENLNHILGTLVTYIAYLIKWGLFIALIFTLGYVSALFRGRRKALDSDYGELEANLGHLAEETKNAKLAVDELLTKAKLKRQSNAQGHRPKDTRFIKVGLWKRAKERIMSLFHAPEKTARVQQEQLVSRLKTIKQEVKSIKDEIKSINIAAASGLIRRQEQEQQEEARGDNVSMPTAVREATPDERVMQSLFRFDGSGIPSDPDVNNPTIERRGAPPRTVHTERENRATDGFPDTNIAREIIELYNEAVTNAAARERFRELHQPIRIGTVNAVERTRNPTIEAEFKETTDGDFFAFAIPGKDEYTVVPRLGLTIEAVSYTAGALGEVFSKTQGHDPTRFYSRYRVRQPATFKRDGESWELLSSGELVLGDGD